MNDAAVISADLRDEILRRLAAAERGHDVRVLLAADSGPRGDPAASGVIRGNPCRPRFEVATG